MTPKTHVFELIQSLSIGEIKVLKEYASKRKKQGNAVYLKLFEVIRNMDNYDESVIRKKFVGEKFLNNLSQAKLYLYKTILLSLRDSNQTDNSLLHSYVEQILILKNKSFYHHTPPIFKKAFSLANKLEDFVIHLKLLELKTEIGRSSRSDIHFFNDLATIEMEEEQLRAKESNLYEYRKLLNRAYRVFHIEPSDRKSEIQAICTHPLMLNGEQCLSKSATITFLNIEYNLLKLQGNIEDRLAKLYEIRDMLLYDSAISHNPSFQLTLLNAIYNCGLLEIFFSAWSKVETAISDLHQLTKRLKGYEILIFERRALLTISMARKRLDYDMGIGIISEIQNSLKRNFKRFHPDKIIELKYTIAEFYINFGKSKEALAFIHDIRNGSKTHREDLHFMSWVLFFIAHYELKNYSTLEYELTPARKYFSKHGKMGSFERYFFKFIKHSIQSGNALSHIPALENLHNEWTGVLTDSNEKAKGNYFRWLPWLKSHIRRIPFTDYLKQL